MSESKDKIEHLDIQGFKKNWKLDFHKSFFGNSQDAYIQEKINEIIDKINSQN